MKQIPELNLKHPGLKLAGGVLAVLVALWLIVQVAVDKREVAQQIYDDIEHVTGYKARAREVKLSFFPRPKVTLVRLEVDNHKEATTESFFVCERVEITLDVVALLMGSGKPDAITVVRPVVELEVFPDGRTNWGFLDQFSLSDYSVVPPSSLTVVNGTLNLNNTNRRFIREVEFIDADVSFDRSSRDMDLNLNFTLLEKKVAAKGILEAKAFSSLSQYNFGLDLDVREGENQIVYKGDIGEGRDGFNYDGVFSFSFKNALPWMEVVFSKEASDGIFKNLKGELPLEISGKAKAEGGKYALTEIKLRSDETAGSGQVISDANVFPQTQAAFRFTSFNSDKIFDPKRSVSGDAFNSFASRLLPKDMSGSVDVRIDDLTVSGVHANDIRFMATLDGGEMVINQAALRMPGETELLVFGIIKRNLNDSIHFDGSMELLGKRMLEFAQAFGLDDKSFITGHTGEFRAKANMFLSTDSSVISGFKFQTGTLLASGGMTSTPGKDYDSEYTLRISGIKLDPFADLLIPSSQKDMKKSDFEDIMRRQPWLDNLHRRLKLNLVLQNYTYEEMGGQQSTMHMILEPSQFRFEQSELELDGVTFKGDISYDQREEFPFIKTNMDISFLNIEAFTARNLRKFPVPRGNYKTVWSEDFFSFSYLKGYNSDLDIRVSEVIHPELAMQNAHLVASSANGKWELKSFQANIWDGVVKMNGTMDIASIPSLSFNFALENIESVKLFEAFAGHKNFLGKLSMNGQVATSGINTHNWVKNARGTFVVLGQNIVVKGFDVASLVQAVPSVRSVADVTNTVRVAMLRRHTTFAQVEGGFFLDGGALRATELKLRAKHSIGVVSGEMDFINWMMNCRIDFGLVTLARGDYPSISILFSNSIDDPEITPDIRSLESFIARKYLRP